MTDTDDIRGGSRRALAKAITLLESSRTDHRHQAEALVTALLPHSGNSVRLGMTGPPGVGKSTLIDSLGHYLVEKGHKVAVLAVDPSSSVSGGSILGDKTRMPVLSTHPNAFIRPSPAGRSLGGVARRTSESIILCEAAGFDVIIVETVGVGQSETLVSEMTDVFMLMLLPGGGDELQGIKRGIMELADIVVVNKADGEMKARARMSAAEMQQALRLLKPRYLDWEVPVLTSSSLEKENVAAIWTSVTELDRQISESREKEELRTRQSQHRMQHEIRELLFAILTSGGEKQAEFEALSRRVAMGELLPSTAARTLVDNLLKNK